jgi:predicted molibdopterin-dependent oxidoreductase YjgC
MYKSDKILNITIDNKNLKVKSGLTILQSAEQNDIYIPTLCAHKDLSPYGGCRMCIVEVEGMKSFVTACTTPVEDGMVVKTKSESIQQMRTEILRLVLSEHTSSCLICDEKETCKESMITIRKAGVTTGCRYCPSDRQCELQDVVEKTELKEIVYPVYYRQLRVEKEDPFYDRDYNLCILCGRCIRVCQEIRGADILTFKQRGGKTVIGPAFDRTHLEAGCEFCGACVSVCPTGALSEKARKWDGKASREEISTCAFCSIGCQIKLQVKNNKIIGSLPADDHLVNHGQLCVKGRFCITEMVNNHQRLKKPYVYKKKSKLEVTWDKAIDLAAGKLTECSPEQFGMIVSPNCSNEDLYIAQKFTRKVMNSHNVDTSARLFYGPGFSAYLNLMKMGVPLSDLSKASVALCIGLDTRYGRSVVGVELKRAGNNGTKIITIHPREHNLAVLANLWLQPGSNDVINLLQGLTDGNKATSESQVRTKNEAYFTQLTKASDMLREASSPVILLGSEFFHYDESQQILETIENLARKTGAGIIPLPAQNNLFGSVLMGSYPEILPGGFSSSDIKYIDHYGKKWDTNIPRFNTPWNSEMTAVETKLKVLYLIGEVPSDLKAYSDFTIFQNIYPPGSRSRVDLVLPSAAFAETDGTFISGEGRIQNVKKTVNPPGEAAPDWEILCRIARKMGKKGFEFLSIKEIQDEIGSSGIGIDNIRDKDRKARPLIFSGKIESSVRNISEIRNKGGRFSTGEHTYRGFELSEYVKGAGIIF